MLEIRSSFVGAIFGLLEFWLAVSLDQFLLAQLVMAQVLMANFLLDQFCIILAQTLPTLPLTLTILRVQACEKILKYFPYLYLTKG